MHRLQQLDRHLQATSKLECKPHEDDIVIVAAIRTPITKAKRGGLKDATPDVLLCQVFQAILKQTGLDPSLIEEIVVGNVLEPGAGANMARIAQFMAGIPYKVPLHVVNRQCSSGLQAIIDVAAGILSQLYQIGLAAGVECMSLHGPPSLDSLHVNYEQMQHVPLAMDCLIPMGITSENVATKFHISRKDQDAFACESHRKAFCAQQAGLFDDEIIPIPTETIKPNGMKESVIISKDDGIREKTNLETLGRLPSVFQENGSTTAGNASQVSDGAAAVLLMRRSMAFQLKLPILGRYIHAAVVGVPPSLMGIGPVDAIQALLSKTHLSIQDIDTFELNEAFASQALSCIQSLQLCQEKVNPKGGAIALGHPLGCTGVRQVVTLLHHLKQQQLKYGIVSMCIGTGMGAAALFQHE